MSRFAQIIILACCVAALLCAGTATAMELFSPGDLVVTGSGHLGNYTVEQAIDGDRESRWVSRAVRAEHWIQVEFPREIEFSRVRIDWSNADTKGSSVMISLSNDGVQWVDVFEDFVPTTAVSETFSFAPQRARFFRLTSTPPERVSQISILELTFDGVKVQEPFLKHVGIGSGNGEPWLPSEGERLAVDILMPIYTETFTWALPADQEPTLMNRIADYRDWFEQVVGHYVYENYHLVLVDVPLSRDEIDGEDTFWMTPSDVWRNFTPTGINPSDYDLVWTLWAWENIPGAGQRYGGAATEGPDDTPFMSFSFSNLASRWNEITALMVLEHEGHHTWESLFLDAGLSIDGRPPLLGMPHADLLGTLLDEMIRLEPGFMEPFMSDEEVMQYHDDGTGSYKTWPGLNLQRGVNAWSYRLQSRENWMKVAEYVGKTVPARGDIVVQPLMASIAIVTHRATEREIYLPVRVRDQGWHIPGVTVTATVDGEVYTLEEDTINRYPEIRMPRQERWSAGWDGNGIYGGWITVTKDTEAIEVSVKGQEIDETFTIPVNYIYVYPREVVLDSTLVYDTNVTPEDGVWTVGENGEYVVFRVPIEGAKAGKIKVTGSGWAEVAVSANGRVFLAAFQNQLKEEPQLADIRPELLQNQEYLYVRVRLAPDYKRPLSAPSVAEVTSLKVDFRHYTQ